MTIFIMIASWAGGVENGNFGVAALLRVSRGSILAVAGQLGVYSVDWTGAAYLKVVVRLSKMLSLNFNQVRVMTYFVNKR